ncbi:MAG: hypothetical protein LBC20_14025 [Planctomycetaceae bacterium]|nr:hypothetical protein [Planctomycetaceae bacterium]
MKRLCYFVTKNGDVNLFRKYLRFGFDSLSRYFVANEYIRKSNGYWVSKTN